MFRGVTRQTGNIRRNGWVASRVVFLVLGGSAVLAFADADAYSRATSNAVDLNAEPTGAPYETLPGQCPVLFERKARQSMDIPVQSFPRRDWVAPEPKSRKPRGRRRGGS
jgi:hypothetical protein